MYLKEDYPEKSMHASSYFDVDVVWKMYHTQFFLHSLGEKAFENKHPILNNKQKPLSILRFSLYRKYR